jgi:hypothetical protein
VRIDRTAFAGLALVVALLVCSVAAQGQDGAPPIAGVVVDQTNAVLSGARIELRDAKGATIETTTSDADGAFRFAAPPRGRVDIVASLEGFRDTTVRVTIGARPPAAIRISMPLASINQHITVTNADRAVTAGAAGNADAIDVDEGLLQSLPVMNQDYVAALSQFLDAGSLGTGGPTLVVNGMEVSALTVSASAIQQIRINQDPYSAEYSRPGRGRIEILTKPGSQEFHGDGNAVLRDAHLDARNAFATSRPPEQRRIAEGFFGGPVRHSARTVFMVSASADRDDQQAIIFALTAAGTVRGEAPQPNSRALASGSVTHQVSDRVSWSIRPSYEQESNTNRGVGGITMASAGTTFFHREEQVTYTQQNILGPGLINQFQFLTGQEREPTTSATQGIGIVVPGAFIGGSAQGDNLRTERHFQVAESLTLTAGHHLVAAGFQVPDWSRRGYDDNSNRLGTFSFADLAAYEAGRPYAFTQQQGNGHIVLLEKVLGLYLKDDWQARPNLTVSLGARYDWTNHFGDHNNLAPRGSLAYSVTPKTVVRGGAGVFYDKPGPAPYGDVLTSRPGGLQRIVITNPGYPDPFPTGTAAPPSIVRFAPDIPVPWTVQYSGGVDRQVHKGTTAAVTYIGSNGRLFRSRDVNAPRPPSYSGRPDPAFGAIRQIDSSARQRSDALQFTLRGKVTQWFNGQAQYTLGRTHNDSGGLYWYPANDYDLAPEWGRADFDRRHRFQLLGRIAATHVADLGVSVSLQSGAPYSGTIGGDIYNNARGNARPAGVGRNTLQGAGYASVDVRASRDVTFGKGTPQARTLTVSLDAFNLLNHVNYGTFVGAIDSPLFGRPITARPPRQLQLSAHLKF